jgi:hypothetical protein
MSLHPAVEVAPPHEQFAIDSGRGQRVFLLVKPFRQRSPRDTDVLRQRFQIEPFERNLPAPLRIIVDGDWRLR